MEVFKFTSYDFNEYQNEIQEFLLESYRINFNLNIDDIKSISHNKFISLTKYFEGESAILFGVKMDSKLVGFLWSFIEELAPEKKLHINQLIVDENYRGLGIATALLNCAEHFAKENNIFKLELNVAYNNVGAKELYKKQGYKPERFLLTKSV